MNIFHAIILGIVEGFTEFLPISSTAHLTVTGYFLGLPETEFFKSFTIIIQLGAILAVVFLFWKRLSRDIETNKKILAAFIPTAVVGFVLYKIIKKYFIGNLTLSLWVLGIGGVLLIVFEKWQSNKIAKKYSDSGSEQKNISKSIQELSYKEAMMIGLGQALAVVPGVSRSAATIISGLFCKLSRKEAVEFSFLLAIPTMLAATGYDFLKNYKSFSFDQSGILIAGLVSSFIFGILGIRFLKYVANASLKGFGWYRIIFAALILFSLSFGTTNSETLNISPKNPDLLVGKWQSIEDPQYIKIFLSNGKCIESYAGIEDEEIACGLGQEYEIIQLNEKELDLEYLPRGMTLSFKRISPK